ncbi:MAG: hypothetical protein ABEH43_11545 [Flavobacteriales bacterium]
MSDRQYLHRFLEGIERLPFSLEHQRKFGSAGESLCDGYVTTGVGGEAPLNIKTDTRALRSDLSM